jgi:methyltransferase (TIGR00027 family)
VSTGDTSLPPVSMTAAGVAVLRAVESERADRLFEDPYAAILARAAGVGPRPEDGDPAQHPVARWLAVRTRFLDDVVLDAAALGCRQVVMLGAGLDTRAFRLPLPPDTHLFELDLPDISVFKERVIKDEGWQPACTRSVVPGDLAGDWAGPLRAAGFDPHFPVTWLAEGLLAYLTEATRDSLLSTTSQLSPTGSRLGLTLATAGRWRASKEAHPDAAASLTGYVALWQSEAPEDAAGWLASLGWTAQVFQAPERSEAYGRSVTGDGSRSGPRLVDAVRR